jgi:1,4-dihydroxy-6-naphthoate synthase
MEERVMRQHIDLYVNEFSLTLGNTGKDAVLQLLKVYYEMNNVDFPNQEDLFVPTL